jgi:hypothetical protein
MTCTCEACGKNVDNPSSIGMMTISKDANCKDDFHIQLCSECIMDILKEIIAKQMVALSKKVRTDVIGEVIDQSQDQELKDMFRKMFTKPEESLEGGE